MYEPSACMRSTQRAEEDVASTIELSTFVASELLGMLVEPFHRATCHQRNLTVRTVAGVPYQVASGTCKNLCWHTVCVSVLYIPE
jgi:hypothetical protein